jgi:hypothetical protein
MHAKPALHSIIVLNVLKTEFHHQIVFAQMENTMPETQLAILVILFTVWLVKLKPITVKNVSKEETHHQNVFVTMELGIITVFVNHVLTNVPLVTQLLMLVPHVTTQITELMMLIVIVSMVIMITELPIVLNVTLNVKLVTSPTYV